MDKKEQARLRKQRQRDRERVTLEDVTSESVTGEDRIEFIQRELNDPYLIRGIEGAAKIFKDRGIRYERAYRYKLWKDGKDAKHPAILHALTEGKLEAIYQSLKSHRVETKVFYGAGKNSMPFDMVGDLLDVTR